MNGALFVWEFPSLSGSVGWASLRYTIQKFTITVHDLCINYIGLVLFACQDSCINYIFLCNVTNRLMMGGGYSLYHIEKLKDFTEQFKSGLIPFL